jgi:hypothetical protein
MADPAFKAAFDSVLAGYRASLSPGNIAVALRIRDDESVEPKARLKACEYLDGPRPLANGVQVNVTQNNSDQPRLAGYVIRLGQSEQKVVEHRADDAPAAPRGQANPCEGEPELARKPLGEWD